MKNLLILVILLTINISKGQVNEYDIPSSKINSNQRQTNSISEEIPIELDFYDVNGNPKIYYAVMTKTFFDWKGNPIGFMEDNSAVFTIKGKHVGWFDSQGLIIDIEGYVVGFLDGSINMPLNPKGPKGPKSPIPVRGPMMTNNLRPTKSMTKSVIPLSQIFN